jgi:5S rRNA maturation endonuclease (ribonuclease M5)
LTGKSLHIVCLDVPYPLDHGGMFDLYCKLPALKNAGVKVHLHCFEYGRGQQPVLNQHCEEVLYYTRRTGIKSLSGNIPYIVNSRRNEALTDRLLQDDHPILLEGIHCTWILNDERFNHRKIFVRLHNIEHRYYEHLAIHERSTFKKLYYAHESRLLKKYEASIAGKTHFLAVSEKDADVYREEFRANVSFLPVFLPWNTVESLPGSGQFCLYHGNLSVAENEEAATWLLEEVFSDLETPFVIAGKDPSRKLQQLALRSGFTCLEANPSMQEMQDLIKKAHINILPSFNNTGVKLKLLNSLFTGKHCIVNKAAIEGSGLHGCEVAETAGEFKNSITTLLQKPFTEAAIADRAAQLSTIYNNEKNCMALIQTIW